MKKPILIAIVTALWMLSCSSDEHIAFQQKVEFELSVPGSKGSSPGRVNSLPDPTALMVSIKDADGQLVLDRQVIQLNKFGETYLSTPISLLTTGETTYFLTEFFVLGPDESIAYATPRGGSELAHLVNNPLDIEFKVSTDATTTVSPEVLPLEDQSNPGEFGYGQFALTIVDPISITLSGFVDTNNQPVDGAVSVVFEKLAGTEVIWEHRVTGIPTEIGRNTLKGEGTYRITISPQELGYRPWRYTMTIANNMEVPVVLNLAPVIYTVQPWTFSAGSVIHLAGKNFDIIPDNIVYFDGTEDNSHFVGIVDSFLSTPEVLVVQVPPHIPPGNYHMLLINRLGPSNGHFVRVD